MTYLYPYHTRRVAHRHGTNTALLGTALPATAFPVLAIFIVLPVVLLLVEYYSTNWKPRINHTKKID
jgi:hypothetical protein